jgi:hypothetical protein
MIKNRLDREGLKCCIDCAKKNEGATPCTIEYREDCETLDGYLCVHPNREKVMLPNDFYKPSSKLPVPYSKDDQDFILGLISEYNRVDEIYKDCLDGEDSRIQEYIMGILKTYCSLLHTYTTPTATPKSREEGELISNADRLSCKGCIYNANGTTICVECADSAGRVNYTAKTDTTKLKTEEAACMTCIYNNDPIEEPLRCGDCEETIDDKNYKAKS